ncbi:MarR family winged helix-turn-helix transcriptional regulator [Arthrobacter crystallopoietes]|uniref:DNA-binding transcriptional regulator, MarR family n=1 Tax=Crystallibacter crystallopoietes TaxID=37928 RepID=A0A1H1CU04_9MICC|nr:MarR family transcriptional regulator [Arthrobacter crystallopoietes]SDQ67704.1 DNA-binding transcriptional regulator, MarR family [Arthrobacter crystallopoietes]
MKKQTPRVGPLEYEELAREAATTLYQDVDFTAMSMCFNLIRVTNRIVKDLEVSVHRPSGISFAGYQLLFSLKAVGRVHPNALARLAGVSTASMSSLLNTLEKYGLITREPDPTDGRKAIVALTDEGESVVAELCMNNNQREQAWAAGLTSAEASILTELLKKLLLHRPQLRSVRAAS